MTRSLETYSPTLKATECRIIKPPSTNSGRQDTSGKYQLVFQLPELQVRTLAALDFKPWMDLGRVTFKGSHPAQERAYDDETMAV